MELIEQAIAYANEKHQHQKRKDGSPYIIHPLAVAAIVAEFGLDTDAILASLLHDCIEDTDASHDDIASRFGETVAELVEGVTKLTRANFSSTEQAQMENLRKMFMAMSKDIRVVLIKIAVIIVQMAVYDVRQHFFADLVIPDRSFSIEVLPDLTMSAAVFVEMTFFAEVCVTGIEAEAKCICRKMFLDAEQNFRRIRGEPDIFDTNSDSEFFSGRQDLREHIFDPIDILLNRAVFFRLSDVVSNVNSDSVDAHVCKNFKCHVQTVNSDSSVMRLRSTQVKSWTEHCMRIHEFQSGISHLFFQVISKAV